MFVKIEERQDWINRERVQERIKLSDAMRIGATKRPQCKGSPFRDGGSCAIGAAYEGRVGKPAAKEIVDPHMAVVLPEIYLSVGHYTPLGGAVYRMNDQGRSREEIADWLESKGY